MITRRRLLAAAVSTPIVLSGCKVRTINYFPPSVAKVRFANLTVGSTGLDVREGDSTIWSAVPFEDSRDFVEFNNQEKTFALFVTGQPNEVARTTVSLAGEQSYTLLSYGSTEVINALLAPDASPNAGDGNFLIRIIDVAAGLPSFDAYFTDPTIPVDDNLSPNFVNLQSGSSTVALRVPAGIYSMRVTVSSTKSVVYDSGPLIIPSGISTDFVFYTLGTAALPQIMRLDVNDGGVRAVVPSKVGSARVINGAVQSGAISVTAGGTSLAIGLAYGTSSLYTLTGVGSLQVVAESASTPGAPIATLQADFPSARELSLVVLGLAGAVRILALVDSNEIPPSGAARARFVNASSDTAAYDVYVGDTKAVSALAAGTASAYFNVNAGTAPVTFRDPGTGAVVLTVPDVQFGDSRVLTIYAVGTANALGPVVNFDR